MPRDLVITDKITIPGWRLVVETARSGGPGGQHANTSDTAVRLRVHLGSIHEVHPGVLRRIRQAEPGSVTKDDELLVTARETRSQAENLAIARERMAAIFREHLQPPKRRKATRPTRASKRRRLQGKRQTSEKKALRGRVRED